ncbi:ABC transporter permease [Shewanella sp. Choline-02u-19]|uniref:PstC family ABC transporter permease n=1 Tax=unclassified Shewanella TaxID=196818 RepID=UPI000C33C64F|nr:MULTISPECIES: ABC transporter permease subunit [unclassified Shewanella]PKH62582.1 ABC transporter permease [Shewanella sp. Bg11-22]PKI27907.1 ABC transporter permease [Shewanella sp. Choline-02u-19]
MQSHNHTLKQNSLMQGLLMTLVVTSGLLLFSVFCFLIWFSLPVFLTETSPVFSLQWQPEQGHFGILAMVFGTLSLALISTSVAFVIAMGINSFCLLSRWRWLVVILKALLKFMAAIPTVVYGLAALFLLLPLLRNGLQLGSGYSLFAAICMLVLLILPVICVMLDNITTPLWQQYALGAHALGLTPEQTYMHVILPHCKVNLCGAALLGFNRSIGDTMLPLMLAGNATQLPSGIFDAIRSLTAHIALVIATDQGSEVYNSLFAAGILLLMCSACICLLSRFLVGRNNLVRLA